MSVLQAAYNDLALTNSKLRDEIDRLQALLAAKTTPGYEMLGTIIEKKDGEIERLQGALKKIDSIAWSKKRGAAGEMQKIARDALGARE